MKFKMKARLNNYSEPVDITSIDFKRGTFTWDYKGFLENIEDIQDAEIFVEVSESNESTQADKEV